MPFPSPSPASGMPPTATAQEQHRAERARRTTELLEQARSARDPAEHEQIIEDIVVLNMEVAESVASRYHHRGIAHEDLLQVAYLALTQAAKRFDPALASGNDEFLAFAVPTIRGELRKHFRDHGWVIRPTRRIQELQPRILAARDELHRNLGRMPRPREIAAHLDEAEALVNETLALDGCYRPLSLDLQAADEGRRVPLGTLVRAQDAGWESAEARIMLENSLQALGERDRRIVFMRFFLGQTQLEIAEELGLTQMTISRNLTRILREIRQQIGELGDTVGFPQQASRRAG
ncbi:MAG: sigma-70 region 2 domain protein [Marmoricola sp.]|nr:sigma-70 region 2 domain protein [Marmoricola sp.]